MRRCDFIKVVAGSTTAWSFAARAQQATKIARIGFLGSTFASPWASRVEAFRSGLRALGYLEGENISIEFRWAEENYDRLAPLAADLIHSNIDVLVTYGTPGSLVAKRATTTVPIVMVHSGDAVAAGRMIADLAIKQRLPAAGFDEFAQAGGLIGIVASPARPGGNLTGMIDFLEMYVALPFSLTSFSCGELVVATLIAVNRNSRRLIRSPHQRGSALLTVRLRRAPSRFSC